MAQIHFQQVFSSRDHVSHLLGKSFSQRSVVDMKLIVRQSLGLLVAKFNVKARNRVIRIMTGSVEERESKHYYHIFYLCIIIVSCC